ncbi:hypothetical protein ACFOUP_02160 [Belliella kenyensis]|uniref:Uncharacterized protein n=1 Tax=Belliella kenyensis TaxID=1472724 RepID=A0ABV8EHC4_9BACT|nr:hypothetical protein [Belliella kenyensis]MCH7401000.1 hypothetical protein [Belliella kenyensis]MDN3603998.1 hypothetical protein [Belliella kenyensis]
MKFYDEVSSFRNSTRSKLKFIDKEISQTEAMLSPFLGQELEIFKDFQKVKQLREELNTLYFSVNVHNPTFQLSADEFHQKSNLLLGEIFGLKGKIK